MNNKKTIIILILILVIGIVGVTIAYFANSSTITNTFNTNPYGTTVTEEFVSPDNWLPGTSTDKSLTVTNTGQVDETVRISYTESWTSKSAKNNNVEGDLPLSQNGNTAALIHFTNTDDWTTVTENGTTYKYYNYKLEPNQTTSELLDYVTFNPAITNKQNCVETPTATGKKITCNSTGEGYDDATYKLTFTIETVQYDKYKEAWNTNINIASMKPMTANDLALKSNPITVTNYLDGNVHEMYTFNHEATEQTPALTDYRYIGDDPYNYVYFNCDSLDNQNSDTCEVWRIIGVFDVDDGNGNWETRIKLVRGSLLPDDLAWNDDRSNDWLNSSLKNYLNNEFYQNLSNQSKNMINEAKYYLGGPTIRSKEIGISIYSYYGSTDQIYEWERGKTLADPTDSANGDCYQTISDYGYCSLRNFDWNGRIALMYPSDYYYVYDKGVDLNCFNDPTECSSKEWKYNSETHMSELVDKENPSFPETSWIYISDKPDNKTYISSTWLLSPDSKFLGQVFNTSGAKLSGNYSTDSHYPPRPTLYLSSSVKIIDGDGSSSNPYKLGF